MANKSDKRIAAENAATLQTLKYGFGLTHLLQILLFLFFRSQRTSGHLTLYVLTSLPSLAIYYQLYTMGTPKAGGKVSDDLSQAGLTQYLQDIVYVTWASQVLGCIWSKGWWLYAIIPAFAAAKAFAFARPLLFGNSSAGQGAADGPQQRQNQQGGNLNPDGSINKEGMSKRQAKLAARYEKGDRRYQMVQKQVPQ